MPALPLIWVSNSQFPNVWLKERKKKETDCWRARNVQQRGLLRERRESVSGTTRLRRGQGNQEAQRAQAGGGHSRVLQSNIIA